MDTLNAAKQAHRAKSTVKKVKKQASSITGSTSSTKSRTKSAPSASSEKSDKSKKSRDVKPADLSNKDPSMIESTASEVVGAMPGSSNQGAPAPSENGT